MLKRKKIVIAILLLIIAGIAIWWFVGRQDRAQNAESPAYRYQLVERSSIISIMEGVGSVQPVNSYTVKALVTGDVLSAPFSEGDMIEAGQLLYQIDAGRAQNSYNLARLNLQEAETEIAELNVTAPETGQVVTVHCETGDSVNVGSQLLYLRDRDIMLLDAPFKTDEAEQLQVGQAAEVILENDGQRISGTIKAISSVEQVSSGGVLTHKLTIAVENPGSLQEGDWAAADAGGFTSVRSGLLEYNYSEQILAKASGDVAEILVSEGEQIGRAHV